MTTDQTSANSKTDSLFIKSAVLSTVLNPRKATSVDISNLISEFSVNESITNNTITITCFVIDNVSLLETYPLRGEERVKFTVTDFQGYEKEYDMFLYKVDNVVPSNEGDGLSYNLYFVSYQHFIASYRKVIRPFKGKKVVSLINDLFEEFYLPGAKKLEIEDEEFSADDLIDNQLRGTIPNLSAPQAIEFLVRRSFSSKRKSSSFRFFENTDSFFYISDEGLEDFAEKNDKIFNFTSTRLPDDPAYLNKHANNLESITNNNRFNTFDDMYGGNYKNTVLEVDILNRIFTERKYDYRDQGKKYFNAGPFRKIVDRHTEEFTEQFFTSENAKKFFIVKDYMDVSEFDEASLPGNKFFPEMISNKHAFRTHLNSTMIEAVGPARLDVCAGNIVNLEITKFQVADNNLERNTQLSGKYIVKSVNRTMNGDRSKNVYVLIKRDWNDVEFTKRFRGGR